MLLEAEFLAIALVLVYVGAVMVLFLFVVMMLDINIERLREGFWDYLPLGAVGGADHGGARWRWCWAAATSACSATPTPAAACRRLQQHQGTGPAALHRLRLSVRNRGGDPAGGDRRGHRADAAPPQGHQVSGSGAAGRGASARTACASSMPSIAG